MTIEDLGALYPQGARGWSGRAGLLRSTRDGPPGQRAEGECRQEGAMKHGEVDG